MCQSTSFKVESKVWSLKKGFPKSTLILTLMRFIINADLIAIITKSPKLVPVYNSNISTLSQLKCI